MDPVAMEYGNVPPWEKRRTSPPPQGRKYCPRQSIVLFQTSKPTPFYHQDAQQGYQTSLEGKDPLGLAIS